DGVLRLAERVLHELQRVVAVDVLDREQILEDAFQSDVGAHTVLAVRLQERLERARLNVEEMGHRHARLQLCERKMRCRLSGHSNPQVMQKALPPPRPTAVRGRMLGLGKASRL